MPFFTRMGAGVRGWKVPFKDTRTPVKASWERDHLMGDTLWQEALEVAPSPLLMGFLIWGDGL